MKDLSDPLVPQEDSTIPEAISEIGGGGGGEGSFPVNCRKGRLNGIEQWHLHPILREMRHVFLHDQNKIK